MARSFFRLVRVGLVGRSGASTVATPKASVGFGSLLGAGSCAAASSVFAPWGDLGQYYFSSEDSFDGDGAAGSTAR